MKVMIRVHFCLRTFRANRQQRTKILTRKVRLTKAKERLQMLLHPPMVDRHRRHPNRKFRQFKLHRRLQLKLRNLQCRVPRKKARLPPVLHRMNPKSHQKVPLQHHSQHLPPVRPLLLHRLESDLVDLVLAQFVVPLWQPRLYQEKTRKRKAKLRTRFPGPPHRQISQASCLQLRNVSSRKMTAQLSSYLTLPFCHPSKDYPPGKHQSLLRHQNLNLLTHKHLRYQRVRRPRAPNQFLYSLNLSNPLLRRKRSPSDL